MITAHKELSMKIAVAGTGYVGLSVALLLSQHHEVHALDIVPEKVELLNSGKSPIVDTEITRFLDRNTSGERPLNFQATLDPAQAYTDADYAVIATPTNYDEKQPYPQYAHMPQMLGSSLNQRFLWDILNNYATTSTMTASSFLPSFCVRGRLYTIIFTQVVL